MASQDVCAGRTHPDVLLSIPLPPDASAASTARRSVAVELRALPLAPELAEDVLLVVSELVTNAVEHSAGTRRLELTWRPGSLVIRVHDHGDGVPAVHVGDSAEARGRGLQLVEAVASAWGHVEEDGGKYVWAEFSVAPT